MILHTKNRSRYFESFNMVKQLIFIAALLAPVLAYGASPAANLAVSVVPAPSGGGNCPTTPPPEAQRAGFTTLAYCLDGAGAKYATPSNWIDCNESWAKTFEWYYGFDYKHNFCTNFTQTTDPQTGKTVVDFHWNSNTDPNITAGVSQGGQLNLVMSNSGCGWTTNFQCASQGLIYHPPTAAPSGGFPAGRLTEIRFRLTPLLPNTDNFHAGFSPALFDWAVECDMGDDFCIQSKGNRFLNENDIIELFGGRQFGDSGTHADSPYGSNICPSNPVHGVCGQFLWAYQNWLVSNVPGYKGEDTQHNYGLMLTTDGINQMKACAYVDHFLVTDYPGYGTNCFTYQLDAAHSPSGTDLSYMLTQRKYLSLWLGELYGPHSNECASIDPSGCAVNTKDPPDLNPGQPDQDYYIEYIAVWTCAAWQTDPTCEANGITQ